MVLQRPKALLLALALALCAPACASTEGGDGSPARPRPSKDGPLASAPTAPAEMTDGGPDPDALFDEAKRLHDEKRWLDARDGLDAYVKRVEALGHRPKDRARYVEALFLRGECEYHGGEKEAADRDYRRILKEYKRFGKIEQVVARELEIGLAFIEGKAERPILFFHWKSESLGREILRFLLDNFQERSFDYAMFQLAESYFRGREFQRAAEAYYALEVQHPTSPWASVAKYQRALCFMAQSRGWRYDPTPLARAEELLLDYKKRNPTGSRIRECEERLAEIRGGRAKLYAWNADYYLFRERRPRSALVYVEALLRETSDAEAAAEAPSLLARVVKLSEEKDPETAKRAKELLAEVDRRGSRAPAPPTPTISPGGPPPTAVPGGAGTSGTGAKGGGGAGGGGGR